MTAPRCTVGQPCTFAAPIFACDYASAETLAGVGPLQSSEVGGTLVREKHCQFVAAGRPVTTEATKSGEVIYLTEGGQHLGYMPVGVFAATDVSTTAEPERIVPVRVTTRPQDLMLFRRGPGPIVATLTGQGTATAVGVFRTGPAERRAVCAEYTASRDPRVIQRCMGDYDNEEIRVRADCEKRNVTVLDETYRLHPRSDAKPGEVTHLDPDRRWLWQEVVSDGWLDGTTASREPTVDSAFDALCPGRRPDADHGLVLRDPAAEFPPAIQGEWTTNAQTCAEVRRAQGVAPVEGTLTIRDRAVQGYEYREELNQLRRLDAQGWTADVSWTGEGDGGQASVGYRLLGETLIVTNGRTMQRLGRCR